MDDFIILDLWKDDWDEFEDMVDFEAYDQRVIRRERVFRFRLQPFDLVTDQQLISKYRFGKVILLELCEMLREQLTHPTLRNNAVSPMLQLLIALRFYASGDHYETIGGFFNVHKSTVCRCISAVTKALNAHGHRYIRMPEEDEIAGIQTTFCKKTSLNRVIGAIDGTHIRIMRPVGVLDAPYINRKGYPSINVFAFCDHLRRIRHMQAKFPGGCHDSSILKTTSFFKRFESGHYGNAVALGDSGYGLRDWLLVPYKFPNGDAEERFNMLQKFARVIIEQTFGILKRRFLVLHSEMRLQPGKVCKVVAACAILHNIAIDNGMDGFDDVEPTPLEHSSAEGDNDDSATARNLSETAKERMRVALAKRNRDFYVHQVVRPQLNNR